MELTLRAFPPGFQPQGQDDEAQVNTLIYTMGDEADDILRSFALSDENSKTYAYDAVLGKIEAHFAKRRNVIFERAKFNLRTQEEGEPVDALDNRGEKRLKRRL